MFDDRSQAIQIGALLLFAFLVVGLSLYQVFIVPSQNSEVEFQHSQRVQSDVLDVRNAVLAAATGENSFVELELGTNYPPRTIFVNPPPPAGTAETTGLEPITVEDGGGTDVSSDVCPGTAETRAFEYRDGYNVYGSAPTVRVENTVAYRRFQTDVIPMSGQRLVTGEAINLVPIRGSYSESGAGTETIEPIPGELTATSVSDPTVRVPTELDEGTWESLLDGTVPPDEISVSGGELVLELTGDYTVVCTPVGINRAPPSGARAGGSLAGGGPGPGGLNPAGANSVRLIDVQVSSNGRTVTVTLENTDDEARTIEQARLPFYFDARGTDDNDDALLNGDSRDDLVVREDFEVVDQTIEIPAGGTRDVDFEFDRNAKGDFYVFSAIYNDSSFARYFVDVPGQNTGGGTPTPTATPGGSVSASLEITRNNNQFTFDASGSSPSSAIDEYRWDFDNDGAIDQTTTSSSVTKNCRATTEVPCDPDGDSGRVVVADTDTTPETTDSATAAYP